MRPDVDGEVVGVVDVHRPVRRGRVRQEIMSATARLVACRGVHGPTLRQVAAEARVSLGSTTYHFADRAALMTAVLAAQVADTESIVDAALLATPDTRPDTVGGVIALFADRQRVLIRGELHVEAARSDDTELVELFMRSRAAMVRLVTAHQRAIHRPADVSSVRAVIAELDATATDTAVRTEHPGAFTTAMTNHITTLHT